jgi:ubiquinone/menaquinone biosynthesis C-methylase UbiE
MANFYDDLAAMYHLIFEDWDVSIERQGEQLSKLVHTHWTGASSLLDVSCGIGTQTLALAKRGYRLTASDLSAMEQARFVDVKCLDDVFYQPVLIGTKAIH